MFQLRSTELRLSKSSYQTKSFCLIFLGRKICQSTFSHVTYFHEKITFCSWTSPRIFPERILIYLFSPVLRLLMPAACHMEKGLLWNKQPLGRGDRKVTCLSAIQQQGHIETLSSKATQDCILNNSNTNCNLWTACVSMGKAFQLLHFNSQTVYWSCPYFPEGNKGENKPINTEPSLNLIVIRAAQALP